MTFDELMEQCPALTNIDRVRAGLQPLVEEGSIESILGRGTWVRRGPPPKTINVTPNAAH